MAQQKHIEHDTTHIKQELFEGKGKFVLFLMERIPPTSVSTNSFVYLAFRCFNIVDKLLQ